MKLWNRRMFVEKEDQVPMSMSMPPLTDTTNSSTGRSLEVSIRTVLASSVACVFLILLTTFFFIGFVFLYFRQFSSSSDPEPLRRSIPQCRGVDEAAAESLRVVPHPGNAEAKEMECAICLEEFKEGEAVKKMPHCSHVFHPECIDMWLHNQVTCPVCRCTIFVGQHHLHVRSISLQN